MVVGTAPGEEFQCATEAVETQVDGWVKEEAEFLDADAKDLREQEMASLVQQDEDGDAEDELQCFYQEYFPWL